MKKNGVSYRVAVLFCSNSILQLMGFAYRIGLSRFAGAASLGLNSLVMQFYGIVVSVCIPGLNVAVSALAAKRTIEPAVLLKTALAVYAALWLAVAAPTFLLSGLIGERALGDAGLSRTLRLMLLCVFMTGIENILRSVHLGMKRVRPCAASEITEQGARFIFVILLLRSFTERADETTVFLIMLGMTASEFISVSFLSVSFIKNFGKIGLFKREKLLVRTVAGPAFPATLTSVSSTVFSSAGSLVLPAALVSFGLTREAALSEIGVLNTVCVPIAALPSALVGAISAVIMPEISQITSENRDPSVLIARSFAAVGTFAAAASILLSIFSNRISGALFGTRTDPFVFSLLSFRMTVIFMQMISSAVLNGLLKQKKVLLFALIGEAYQLVLILLLTPVLGLKGYLAGMITGEILRLVLSAFEIRDSVKNCGFCGRDMLKSSVMKT